MAETDALTDTDCGALIQGAAATALSPFCDPNDDDWRDAAADQVRDAVLTALADEGLIITKRLVPPPSAWDFERGDGVIPTEPRAEWRGDR